MRAFPPPAPPDQQCLPCCDAFSSPVLLSANTQILVQNRYFFSFFDHNLSPITTQKISPPGFRHFFQILKKIIEHYPDKDIALLHHRIEIKLILPFIDFDNEVIKHFLLHSFPDGSPIPLSRFHDLSTEHVHLLDLLAIAQYLIRITPGAFPQALPNTLAIAEKKIASYHASQLAMKIPMPRI